MGKIYCTKCGAELDDTMKFCSECGTKLKVNSNNTVTESSSKVNKIIKDHDKKSTATKIGLGIVLGVVLLIILSVVIVGVYVMVAPSNTADTSSENLTPSFTDTIDGITFNIPEGYTSMGGTDNIKKGTYYESYRNYHSKENGGLYIHVGTPNAYSQFDLNQNRHTSYEDVSINGHEGIYSSTFEEFQYIDDGKLVIIEGVVDEKQLEEIIVK